MRKLHFFPVKLEARGGIIISRVSTVTFPANASRSQSVTEES